MKIIRGPSDRRHRAGFSLLEVVVSLGLLAVLLSSLLLFLDTSREAQREGVAQLELETRGRRAVDRIVEAVRAAERSSVTPAVATPWTSPFLEFQASLGDQAGAVAWGDPVRLWHDAVARRVVRTDAPGLPGERHSVWCGDVPPREAAEVLDGADGDGDGFADETGLAFAVDGDVVTVLLALEEEAEGGRLRSRSFRGVVRCRN